VSHVRYFALTPGDSARVYDSEYNLVGSWKITAEPDSDSTSAT
jgi:hypothetical protein